MPPPIPRPPQRSIAGPVVLILMGVLFLLGTMGILEIHSLGRLFARFWPALLILWGLLKLMEYEQAKRYGLPARGIGVGGIFLMFFLICAGLIATQASRVNWKSLGEHIQLGDDEGLDEIFGGSTFDYSGEASSPLPVGSDTLRVNDDRGTVTVNVSDEKKVRIAWRKKVHAEKQEGAGDKGVTMDMDIYVPANVSLTITSGRGDVTVAGRIGTLEINHRKGEVNVNNQTGSVSLNLDGSSARLQHIKGDVTIQGKANEVSVEDVDGTMHLNGEFQESLRLVRISRTITFHSSRTEMEFARLEGRLDLDSGDLRADTLTGPMRLTTRSKDIALEGLSGDLRLEDSNGSVDVAVRKPGNIQIDNRKGDVQVSIPPNTAIKVEARTKDGEIESDFSEIKVESQERGASASGSVGTNGPRLAVNCDHGAIEIRKARGGTAGPVPPFTQPSAGKP